MNISMLVFVAGLAVTMAAPLLSDTEEWQKFKLEHNRNYSDSEDAQRFEIFKRNLEIIRKHNEKFDKGLVSWKMGINQFTDKTSEERKRYLGFGVRPKEN